MIEVHINPYFNELAIPLQKLSSLHLQRYYQFEMEHGRKNGKGGLSSNTVRKHHIMDTKTSTADWIGNLFKKVGY